MRTCEICGIDISHQRKNSNTCSKEHRVELYRRNKELDHMKKYENNSSAVECKICGYKATRLEGHLVRQHQLKLKDYYNRYNVTAVDCFSSNYRNNLSEHMLGKKNPGYAHGGKYSPWSKKSGIDEISRLAALKKAQENRSYNTQLDYWVSRSVSTEEANKKLLERQATFTKFKCIEKFGEKEGIKRFLKRQEKWQMTLNKKSPEEIERINILKMSKGFSVSKGETALFEIVSSIYPNAISQKAIHTGDRTYVFDIFVPEENMIIEYNGDFWHCNPKKYRSDWKNPRTGRTTSEQQIIDMCKIDFAKSCGFDVFVVWESELENKKECLKRCLTKVENVISVV